MYLPSNFVVIIIFLGLSVSIVSCDKPHKKYSKDMNEPKKVDSDENYERPVLRDIEEPNFRTLKTPYRMAKLNLVWSKAQHVSNI